MSKKNKLVTRQKAHADALRREKEAATKRAAKLKKRHLKRELGVKKPVKSKHKPVRIRKGVVVRGIKVKDAESKRRIRELLRTEAQNKMQIDSNDGDTWEEATEQDMAAFDLANMKL